MTETTAKIQLRGHCQCCGRVQAVLSSGRMSKHGYEVKDHYFQGVCNGDRYEPIEVKRDMADAIIKSVREDAEALRQKVKKIKAGKLKPTHVKGHYRPSIRDYEMIPFDEAPEYKQKEAIESLLWNTQRRSEMADSFANGHEQLVNAVHGRPLQEVKLAPPAPRIEYGETRKLPSGGVAVVTSVEGQRVYWKDENGRKGWTSPRSWRQFEKV